MKEIKFRAWDKENKEMCIIDRLTFMFEDINSIMAEVIKDINEPSIDEFRRMVMPEHLELMQYTGLKDKNGVEIYEGDIVKWFTDDIWKFGKVYYGEQGWEIDFYKAEPPIHKNVDRQVIFKFQSFWPLSDEHDIKDSKFEVIGNIYENPELIK